MEHDPGSDIRVTYLASPDDTFEPLASASWGPGGAGGGGELTQSQVLVSKLTSPPSLRALNRRHPPDTPLLSSFLVSIATMATSPTRPSKRSKATDEPWTSTTVSAHQPRLFAPFRALGFIANHVPISVQTRGNKSATKGPSISIVSCLGDAWAMWEGEKMGLVFVGQSRAHTPSPRPPLGPPPAASPDETCMPAEELVVQRGRHAMLTLLQLALLSSCRRSRTWPPKFLSSPSLSVRADMLASRVLSQALLCRSLSPR